MKHTTIAAIAAVALLTLTGCAESAGNATDEHGAAETSTAAAPSETPEPLVAETPEALTQDKSEEQFIGWVRQHLRPDNIVPNATDEQLLTAGEDGCTQIRDEVAPDDLTVIAGEERDGGGYFRDSSVIVTGARMFLCPDRIDG
ncbi:hypothetical protein NS234_12265 [Microbacterium oxydans]|uniref:hypothetical protein n=1 Tax=Microbacterium oxydans TaxID=82380 RepID=UPI000734C478|nr:hypothetical protein [Microbacterium oxydans]KTR76194.1 hypothetical protein NS234_12265 [Microbacterium oxydans]